MATNSSTDTNVPDMSQLSTDLNNSLATADSTTTQRVQNLQLVHQARVSHLSRTAASLKAQYGAENDEVKATEAAVAATKFTAARVAVVHQQLSTPQPQVATNGWAVHGRVFDAQLQPLSGFTVFLVDATKTYQQAYGFAYTDDTGYFLLNYAGTDTASQKKSTAQASTATVPELFLEVADTKSQPVYLGTTAVPLTVGQATYQNIILPAGNASLGDPPAPLRSIALPKTPRKK